MVRPETANLKIDEMKVMEMPGRGSDKLMVTVNEQGFFTVGTGLLRKLKLMFPELEMEIRRSDDARFLVFREAESYKFMIGKTGHFKYTEFMETLKGKGYHLPARYVVGWNDRMNAWVGVLQEVEEAPDVRSLAAKEPVPVKSRRGRGIKKVQNV